MKLTRDQLSKGALTGAQKLRWQLERERFRIQESFPQTDLPAGKKIGDILSGILQKEEHDTSAVPPPLSSRWQLIAGEQLASHVSPSHLKNGVLYLQADHPGWLAELRRLPKTGLLKKIASIPDTPEIKDIRFQLDPAIRTGRK